MDLHINETAGDVTQFAMLIFEDKIPLINKLARILILTLVDICNTVAFTY
jgi:hypothetical protein